MMDRQLFLPMTEASQVAEARRLTTGLANDLGFNETEAGKVAIVLTEAATNLVKHAHGGRLLVRTMSREGLAGLEILALDQGPGIPNIGEALRNGHSTTGSPGTGLGAIARLSTFFNIYTLPGTGTALLAHLWAQDGKRPSKSLEQGRAGAITSTQPTALLSYDSLDIGLVCLPKLSEGISGDSWAVKRQADRCLIMIADGLGHGPLAAAAASAAVRILKENSALAPAALIEAAHGALRSTRGAALAVVELDLARQVVRFAGVGNIAGQVLTSEQSRHLTSYNGTVGLEVHKIQEFTYPWPTDALLIMHSDGLTMHWDLKAYPGLMSRHPSLIAGVLYRDFNRGHDDVTVLVVKQDSYELVNSFNQD